MNREFPKWYDKGQTLAELMWNGTEQRQPEAQAAIKWIMKHPFVLSGNVHDGAVLVNYPFDDGGGIWKLTKEKGVKVGGGRALRKSLLIFHFSFPSLLPQMMHSSWVFQSYMPTSTKQCTLAESVKRRVIQVASPMERFGMWYQGVCR